MIPARISLWLMLYFCILCYTFSSNNINIAIVSMVRYSEEAAENATRACSNVQAASSNSTFGQETKFSRANSQITFEWSKNDRNLVLGAIYAFPWVSPFLGGFLSHKYGTKLVAGWCIFIACMLSSLIPLVAPISPMLVVGVRIIQGIISPAAVPSGIYPLAGTWFPAHERGKFFLVLSAFSIGNGLSFVVFGFVVDIFGWPYVFYATSLCGFLWFLLWQYYVYDSPDQHPRISTGEKSYIQKAVSSTVAKEKLPVPWKAIFTSKPFVINVICQIGVAFVRLVFVMYLPIYFKLIHGLNPKDNGLVTGLPYILRAGVSCIFAVLVDQLMLKKISKTGIRNLFTFIGSVVSGALLIGVAFARCNTYLAVLLSWASVTLTTAFIYGAAASMVDMSPNFCGVLTGIAGSISSLSGLFIPFVITFVSNLYETDLLEQWKMIWLISGSIYTVTGLIFILWSESELQPWNAACHQPSDEKLLNNVSSKK